MGRQGDGATTNLLCGPELDSAGSRGDRPSSADREEVELLRSVISDLRDDPAVVPGLQGNKKRGVSPQAGGRAQAVRLGAALRWLSWRPYLERFPRAEKRNRNPLQRRKGAKTHAHGG